MRASFYCAVAAIFAVTSGNSAVIGGFMNNNSESKLAAFLDNIGAGKALTPDQVKTLSNGLKCYESEFNVSNSAIIDDWTKFKAEGAQKALKGASAERLVKMRRICRTLNTP